MLSHFIEIAVALVALNTVCAVAVASYAARKGLPAIPVFLAAACVSCPLALLVVVVAPPRSAHDL